MPRPSTKVLHPILSSGLDAFCQQLLSTYPLKQALIQRFVHQQKRWFLEGKEESDGISLLEICESPEEMQERLQGIKALFLEALQEPYEQAVMFALENDINAWIIRMQYDALQYQSKSTTPPLNKVIESMQEGVIIRDDQGMIIACNSALTRILKRSKEELIGQRYSVPLSDVILEDGTVLSDGLHPAIQTLRTGQAVRGMRLGFRVLDEICWISVNTVPLYENTQHYVITTLTDITESHKATQSLQISERRWQNMFDRHDGVMLLIDPTKGAIVNANRAALRYYGYDKDHLLTMHIDDLNVLSTSEVQQEMERAKEEQRNYFLFSHRLQSGEIRDVEVHSTPIETDDGLILFSIIHDITERNAFERSLKNSQRRLEDAQRIGHIGHWELDLQTDTLTWSKEVYHIFGLVSTEESLDYRSFLEYVHPLDQDEVHQAYLDSLTKYIPYRIEHRIIREDGVMRYVREECEHEFDEHGKVIRSIGTIHDITESKKLELKLHDINLALEEKVQERTIEIREINHLLQDAERLAQIGSYQWKRDTDEMIWSQEMYRLLGYDTEKITPTCKHLATLFMTQEDKETFKRGFEEGELSFECKIKRLNGEILYVQFHAFSSVEHPNVIRGVMQNITELRLLEEQKRDQGALLIQQSKMAAMGEMVGAIAHQWKQPLSILALYLQELEDLYSYNELDEAILSQTVKDSMAQIEFMSETIEHFRNFIKPNKHIRTLHVQSVMQKVLKLLERQLENRGVKVMQEIEESLEIQGVENEFQQVLLNLICNAKDAFYDKSVLAPNIVIRARKEDQQITIEVQDNAGGVLETLLPTKLFSPYETTKGSAGTGIGLYLVRLIVEEKMMGEISAKNLDEGACFTLKLPISVHS